MTDTISFKNNEIRLLNHRANKSEFIGSIGAKNKELFKALVPALKKLGVSLKSEKTTEYGPTGIFTAKSQIILREAIRTIKKSSKIAIYNGNPAKYRTGSTKVDKVLTEAGKIADIAGKIAK